MAESDEELRRRVLVQLTAEEARECVVYLATAPPIARGELLTFPRLTFTSGVNGGPAPA
jgi:hypothetical protein